MDQQSLYQHLLSPDYPYSTLLSPTSPLLTGCIGVSKQDELFKSDDTNKSAQAHIKSTKKDCKQGAQDKNDWNQWFDDEFASIYRQYHHQQEEQETQKQKQTPTPNSGIASQSSVQSSHPKKNNHHHHKNSIQNLSTSSTTTNDDNSLPDQISVTTRHVNHSPHEVQQPVQPFPWPESVEQIYGWCRIAKKSQDVKSQVKLCRRLLVTLARDAFHSNQEQAKSNIQCEPTPHSPPHAPTPPHSLESSMLSLPSLSSTSTSTSLSSSAPSVDHDHIRHVMTRECLRILKQQSIGKGLGKVGDSEAQFILANCHGIGLLGLTEDHNKAFQLFMQASKQSHPEATYRTAVCYELGIGTRKDGQRAMIFYRKSAHLLHAGSMYKLGMILLRGYHHTAPTTREAISWLQRAASHITSTSSPIVDVPTTATATTTTTSPSCFSKSKSSSSLLSMNFSNKTCRRRRGSKSFIASATSQVHHHQAPHALHALAMIQMKEEISNTTSLIADPVYAIELLHQAATRDHIPSQLQLGHCFEHGQWVPINPINEVLSIYWYSRAAQLDSPEGCLAIADWYLTGTSNKNVLPPSDNEAYLWSRRAIALAAATAFPTDRGTMAKAHFSVAVLLERGVNLDNHLSTMEATKKVRTWMLKAAALGHQGASQWLQDKQKADRQLAEQGHDVNDNVQIDQFQLRR